MTQDQGVFTDRGHHVILVGEGASDITSGGIHCRITSIYTHTERETPQLVCFCTSHHWETDGPEDALVCLTHLMVSGSSCLFTHIKRVHIFENTRWVNIEDTFSGRFHLSSKTLYT